MKTYLHSVILMVATLVLLYSPNSSAASAFQCNSCTSAQMKDLALLKGNGSHHIVDLNNNVIKQYFVNIEKEGFISIKTALEIQPNQAIKSVFDNTMSAKRGVMDAIFELPTVPADIAGSAWELSGNSQNQNNVGDWFVSQQSWNEAIGNYTGMVLSLVGQVVGINLVVDMSFSDGSEATYKIDGINLDGSLSISLIDATDAENNSVPLTLANFPGTYSFTSGSGGGGSGINGITQAAGG
jgi:hypothetical protein